LIELRTLGTWEVRIVDGTKTRDMRLEPKRMALLVYLAVEHRMNVVARDQLIAIFWPDLDEAAARSALRQSLHYLGSRLGSEAIAGRGTPEVGLSPDRVCCDAVEFERFLDGSEPVRALRRFSGSFLPGFYYARQSRDFEEWVETQRQWLTERAFEAALTLAEDEAVRGNTTGQTHWLKRALQLEPFREDVLRDLVDVYARTGNRATAVQTIRRFAQHLSSHYRATLSPQTGEVLKQLEREIAVGTRDTRAETFRRMRSLEEELNQEMARTAELLKQLRNVVGPGVPRTVAAGGEGDARSFITGAVR
jgi:DNA-binding SARP family transcriptional activator